MDWKDIQEKAVKALMTLGLDDEYKDRLVFEFKEIQKQGTENYWLDLIKKDAKFDHNNNGLVLPFLLGVTPIDPIKNERSYIIDEDGDIDDDVVVISLDDREVTLPSVCLIKTSRGIIRASELNPGDEIIN